MRILIVNKFYWKKGGAERVMFDLARGYERAGHEVVPFAMASPQDEPSEYASYFVPNVEYHGAAPAARARAAMNVVHSREAKRRLARLIADVQPDVAHLHNFHHQLSPSIVDALREASVPAVHTLHDYKVICPNYLLYTEGAPCVRCRGGRFFEAVRHRCVHGSRSASLVSYVEMTWHDWRGTLARGVRRFVAPSRFLAEKLREFDFGGDSVQVVPNGIDASEFPTANGPGHGFLYAGRLSAEKGVATLVAAAALARVPLEIAGDGPALEDLRRHAQRCGADVRFLGRLDRDPLHERLRRARAVVLPSEWYENAPMAALEALASAVPVVGAAIGGIPEMVRDGETGLLFEPRNVEGLAACLVRLDAEPDFAHRLGAHGREVVEREFSLADQVSRMLQIFGEVMPSASR